MILEISKCEGGGYIVIGRAVPGKEWGKGAFTTIVEALEYIRSQMEPVVIVPNYTIKRGCGGVLYNQGTPVGLLPAVQTPAMYGGLGTLGY